MPRIRRHCPPASAAQIPAPAPPGTEGAAASAEREHRFLPSGLAPDVVLLDLTELWRVAGIRVVFRAVV